MDYNDMYGYGSYEEPQRHPVPPQPKKPAGCMGCLLSMIVMMAIGMFIFGGIIFAVVGYVMSNAANTIDEDPEVIESYFEEHEDEIADVLDDMGAFMEGLEDAFEGGMNDNEE